MATPTSAIDDLLGLFSPDEAAVVRAVVLKNDKAKAMLDEGLTMRKEYLGEPTPGDDGAAAEAARVAEVARVAEAARAAARASAGSSNGASAELAAISRQLTELSSGLTTKIDDLAKNAVTKTELTKHLGDNLGLSIRNAHQAMRIEMQHTSEFPGEKFDLDKVNEYFNAEVKKGRQFKDLQAVYDEMYQQKRIDARIAAGIAEGVKAKRSADAATGASGGGGTTALAPNQELIRKMKGEAGSQDHVLSMADKLRKIREARESREGGADEGQPNLMPAKGQRALQLAEFEARLVNIPAIDWARLAAYIDGEGTIYINRTRASGAHLNTRYMLSVLITNSSLPLLNWLQKTFGGSLYDKNFHGKNPLGHRPMKTWHVNEGQASTLLQHCLPYFIVKRQQAEIGIAFRELKSRGKRGVLVPPQDMAQREELRNKIHLLNSPKFEAAS